MGWWCDLPAVRSSTIGTLQVDRALKVRIALVVEPNDAKAGVMDEGVKERPIKSYAVQGTFPATRKGAIARWIDRHVVNAPLYERREEHRPLRRQKSTKLA